MSRGSPRASRPARSSGSPRPTGSRPPPAARARARTRAQPSAVWPSAGCSSSSASPRSSRPGTGSACTAPEAERRRPARRSARRRGRAARAGPRPGSARRRSGRGLPHSERQAREGQASRAGGRSRACVASRPSGSKPAWREQRRQRLELVREVGRVDQHGLAAGAHDGGGGLPHPARHDERVAVDRDRAHGTESG